MQFKRGWNVALLFLSAFLVSCTQNSQNASEGLLKLWNSILWIGGLGFLGSSYNPMEGFMRVMLVILVFSLLYFGAGFVFNQPAQRNSRIAVSLIIAIISVVFISGNVLAAIGAAYGTAVAFILLGSLIGGGFWLTTLTQNHWIRLVILILLLIILNAIHQHAGNLLAIGPMTIN